jgi:[ribosomal protein S5]-alanine N-acetyltransferase
MFPQPSGEISSVTDFIDIALEGINQRKNLQLVVLDKATDSFLGCSGIHQIDSETPELGLWIKRSAHHLGYGFESICAIVA